MCCCDGNLRDEISDREYLLDSEHARLISRFFQVPLSTKPLKAGPWIHVV